MKLNQRNIKENKIKGTLTDRADPDSGLDDVDNKEWKVYFETGGESEVDKNSRKLQVNDENMDPLTAKEVEESFQSCQEQMAGNKPQVRVKTEEETKVGAEAEAPKVDEEPGEEESGTVTGLKKKPKQVLRMTSDVILHLKEMFQTTGGQFSKYCNEMHEDITKLIPKFAKHHRAVEGHAVKRAALDADTEQLDVEAVAIATKLDESLKEYNEIVEPYSKFFPKSKKQKTGKV